MRPGLCMCKEVLETGVKFDYAHFWEDICFKNGPLISPDVFREFVGPWYKKITDRTSSMESKSYRWIVTA